jgi:hypothetical protein
MSLPSYADSVIVRFTLRGGVDVTLNANYAEPGKFAGPVDGQGYSRLNECRVQVTFKYNFNGTLSTWGPGVCGGTYRGNWVDTAVVRGQGTVTRGGPIYQEAYECPGHTLPVEGHNCWWYHTGEAFEVDPIFVPISLTTPGTVEAAPGVIEKPQPGIWTLFRIKGSPDTVKVRVPIRVVSWRWEAAVGGVGQTVLTGGATAIQRSAYITEEGRMIVDAFVNGVEQQDTIAVVVPVVRITASSSMRPSTRTPAVFDISSQTIGISVSGFNGVGLRDRSVKVQVVAKDLDAGHNHSGGKPPGQLFGSVFDTTLHTDTVRVNTGSGGTTTVLYVAPDPSGQVTFTGTSGSATTGTAQVMVKIDGLQQYSPGAHYDTVGTKPIHPINNWATPGHIARLQELADIYFAEYGSKVHYNDTSLQYGGLFDVDSTRWTYAHRAHRAGRNTDVRTTGLDQETLDFLASQWRRCCGKVIDETSTSQPHYHLVSKD